jgi:hypothetical protein
MRPEEIRDHLRAAPFRPLRVFLSDGSYHVPHPDFAFVTVSHLIIAKEVNSRGVPRRTVTCDPLHVTRIEPEPQNGGPA